MKNRISNTPHHHLALSGSSSQSGSALLVNPISSNTNKRPHNYKLTALVVGALSALLSVTGFVESVHAAPYSAEGKFYRADKPIKDAYGRTRYIVVLEEPPLPTEEIKAANRATDLKEALILQGKYVREYVEGFAKSKSESVTIFGATSFVFPSFTAYLTEKEAKNYADDKRVTKIAEDSYATTSAGGHVAQTSSPQSGSEIEGWGLAFMNNSNPPPSTGRALVHVIDAGTETHPDLDAYQFNSNSYSYNPSSYYRNPVGCYPHATHVAGIIGAKKNGFGAVGMVPSVTIYSHATSDTNIVWWRGNSGNGPGFYDTAHPILPPNLFPSIGECSGTRLSNYVGSPVSPDPSIPQTAVVAALDVIFFTTQYGGTGVVNMSFNGSNFFDSGHPVAQAMQSVATPRFFYAWGYSGGVPNVTLVYYPGSLIIQSAGNDNNSYCNKSYNSTTIADGIIVVGGIDSNGERSGIYSNYVNIFTEASPYTVAPRKETGQSDPGGSNYGSCVEMWAPSNNIYSTWTTNSGPAPYRELSGTSMAAPHVAGFAAALIERNPATVWTAVSLETAVRAQLVPAVPGSTLLVPKF